MKAHYKNLLSAVLAAVMLLGTAATPALAAGDATHISDSGTQITDGSCGCFTVDGIIYEPLTEDTVAVVNPGYHPYVSGAESTYSGSITIPATVTTGEDENKKTYNVVKIGSGAFAGSDIDGGEVASVSLPEGLTEIGERAFFHCENLSSLNIPSTVTTIGSNAFGKCSDLTDLTIPAGVTSGVPKALGMGTSDSNDKWPNLANVKFADGSPYENVDGVLYKGTVMECVLDDSKTEITVRDDTKEIAAYVLGRASNSNPGSTSPTIILPSSVTVVGESAFPFATISEKSDLSNITTIGDYAFKNSAITAADLSSATTIGKHAFYGCSALTSVEFSSDLTSMGEAAFRNTALTEVVIPEGLSSIPKQAFLGCSTLKTVVIPESVSNIGQNAFNKAFAEDATLIMMGKEPPTVDTQLWASSNTPTDLTVIVPSGSESNYSAEGSAFKTYITTTDGGNGTTKPGISYKLEMSKTVSIVNGETESLGTAIVPTGWTLNVDPSNNDVVTINELAADTGAVTATANSVGTVTVKFSITNDSGIVLAEQTCKITVTAKPVPVTGITLSETSLSLREGKTETLTATVEPENATDKTITWTSSDESIAKVDANGVVTAVSAGTATIKATIGTVFDECAVTVTKKPSNSGNSSTPTYTVSTPSKVENGTVNVSPKSASKGTTVTITVKPDSGYELDDLTVTDKNGDTVKLTRKSDTQYTFTMPASKVDIEVTFAEIDTTCDGGRDCPSYHFVDVNVNDWYHEAVDYMVERGLMNGTSATTFAPNTTTTRAMLVSVLYRMENYPAVVGAASFNDVPAGQYYTDAVAWASANGIVTGYGNGNFGPNDTLTREQMAAIIYRYAAYKGYDVSARANLSGYTDAAQISGYAADAMAWINAEDIIGGTSATTLSPAGNATRCQFAVILMRFCENVAK